MGMAVGSEKVAGLAVGSEKVGGMALGSEKFFDAGGAAVPAAPASLTLSRATILGEAGIRFTWPAVTGATYYEREIVGVRARRSTGARTSQEIFQRLVPVGSVFRVWACNAHGCSTSPVTATWNG